MPVVTHDGGGATITGNAILGMRFVMLKHAMKAYLSSNGRMLLTRGATPAVMREIAFEFTGKTYARSRKGLEKAYADILELETKRHSLDELGETHVVNAAVGGVASDLTNG